MEFSNKILYKQYTDISNQTNKYIIQKQGYLFGHLKFNVKLSPRHSQWSRTRERLENWLSKKGLGISTFPFQDYIWSRHLFFCYKKNRKKEKNTQSIYLNNTTLLI